MLTACEVFPPVISTGARTLTTWACSAITKPFIGNSPVLDCESRVLRGDSRGNRRSTQRSNLRTRRQCDERRLRCRAVLRGQRLLPGRLSVQAHDEAERCFIIQEA